MSTKNSYWYKQIASWCRGGGNGLTLPYLVGSQSEINKTFIPDTLDLELLLNEFKKHDAQEVVIELKWCPNLETLVVGINSINSLDTHNWLLIQNNNLITVAISKICLQNLGITSTDEKVILNEIIEEYSKPIKMRTYSRNNKEWQAYTTDEKQRIRNLIG